jgi:hypothetical protein
MEMAHPNGFRNKGFEEEEEEEDLKDSYCFQILRRSDKRSTKYYHEQKL